MTEEVKDTRSIIDVELTTEEAWFILEELCRRDMRPSEYLVTVMLEYVDKNAELKEALSEDGDSA